MSVTDPDPTALRSNRPALVDVDGQGPVFVAHASTLDNGWLRVREWSGTTAKLPPHRVRQVRYLKTEPNGERWTDGRQPKQLADETWREKAIKWTTTDEAEQDDEQVVIA